MAKETTEVIAILALLLLKQKSNGNISAFRN